MHTFPVKPEQYSENLDYWEFVSLASSRLNEAYPPSEVKASHLALALNRTSEILRHVSESRVHRRHNLQWSGFRMLFVLWHVGEIEQSRLTVLTNSSKATVSNIILSLSKRGLVKRGESSADRRTFMVDLTAAGLSLVEEVYLEQNRLFVKWASVLDADELDTLRYLVNKLMNRRDMFGIDRTN